MHASEFIGKHGRAWAVGYNVQIIIGSLKQYAYTVDLPISVLICQNVQGFRNPDYYICIFLSYLLTFL